MTTRISIASLATGATTAAGDNVALSALCVIGQELRRAADDAVALREDAEAALGERLEIAIVRSHEVSLAANRLTRALRRELAVQRAAEKLEKKKHAFASAAWQTWDTAELMRVDAKVTP